MSAQCEVTAKIAAHAPMSVFERYLTVWVALCMVAGVLLGKALPGIVDNVRGMEFGGGSQISVPIAGISSTDWRSGGDIRVASTPGAGTEVEVMLRVHECPDC